MEDRRRTIQQNWNSRSAMQELEVDRKFRWGKNSNGVAKRISNHSFEKLAHDVPMSGHFGWEKTLARVGKHFWWPGVTINVAEYCRLCKVCQRTARKGPKAPLILMPIIGVPFKRIAMDVIGHLPMSSTGKQYVLVITDYATIYISGNICTAKRDCIRCSSLVQYICSVHMVYRERF